MPQKIDELEALRAGQPVIPVIVVEDRATAVPMARALVAGGLPMIEITLRTEGALDAIRAVADEVEGAVVGAGTVLTARQFGEAVDAGARFVVSPGTTRDLIGVASTSEVPLLPGATTPSEVMAAMEEGYRFLKFFPAEASGGASFLKALSSPLSGVRFCPTGGIGADDAADYLALPNVACVGGSWVAPKGMVEAGDWAGVERLARAAAALAS